MFTHPRNRKQLDAQGESQFGRECMLGKLCRLEKWCGLARNLTHPGDLRECEIAPANRTLLKSITNLATVCRRLRNNNIWAAV